MLELDIFVVLAQLINFGILYYIFKSFVADKLNAKIKLREEQLAKLEKADEHYEEKMKLAEEERKKLVENARKTSRSLMKESEIVAKAKAEAIMQKAHNDALAVLDGGRREIEKERKTMLAQMKDHIMDVTLRLNEKMFGKGQASKDFLEAELAKMK